MRPSRPDLRASRWFEHYVKTPMTTEHRAEAQCGAARLGASHNWLLIECFQRRESMYSIRSSVLSVLLLAGVAGAMATTEYSVADEQLVEAGFFGSSKAMLVVPAQPKALLLLFPGGDGALKLSGKKGIVNFGTQLHANFLVRSRRDIFEKGYAILVMDSPGGSSLSALQRGGSVGSVKALVEKSQAAEPSLRGVPVWALGTSAGTISVAHLIASEPDLLSGAVLTSSITRRYPGASQFSDMNPKGVASMRIGSFTKPVLVVSHKDDLCAVTPAADAEMLAASFTASVRKKAIVLEGAANPNGDQCEAFTAHGFYDMEKQVVELIDQFISAGPRN
jgi:hypothetical protein